MGQAAVRNAVYELLLNANVPYVGAVYPARQYINEQDYEVNAANHYVSSVNGSGAVLVVNLPGPDLRTRIADTGRNAQYDMNVHAVALELFFAAPIGDPVLAQQDYDTIIDFIVPYIRQNPTLLSTDVWSAGEYRAGVSHTPSAPYTAPNGMTVMINGVIRFEAWEQITNG